MAAGRAHRHAGRAAAAMLAALRWVDGQRQIGVDLAEEEPRAAIAADEVRVLAYPSETGVPGQGLLEDRGTVGEDPVTRRSGDLFDPGYEATQPAPQDLVVVASQRIA